MDLGTLITDLDKDNRISFDPKENEAIEFRRRLVRNKMLKALLILVYRFNNKLTRIN
jgi:hypothetical protein